MLHAHSSLCMLTYYLLLFLLLTPPIQFCSVCTHPAGSLFLSSRGTNHLLFSLHVIYHAHVFDALMLLGESPEEYNHTAKSLSASTLHLTNS